MSVLYFIIIGFVIGLIARALKPGDDRMGIIMTILLGIAGSFVAAYIGKVLGWYHIGEAPGFIASVFGAIAVLLVVQFVQRRV